MTLVNLTRPIRVDASPGAVLPWETPYRTEPIATLEHNGANLFFVEMSPAAATRLVGRRIADPTATATRDIDMSVLLNRHAVLVRVPTAAGGLIEASDLAAALEDAAPRPGDALIVHTGWGDQPAEALADETYVLEAPSFSAAALQLLRAELSRLGSDLLLTDLPYLEQAGGPTVRGEWGSLVPWLRPAWPSSNAQAYVRHYTAEKVAADWSSTLGLLDEAWLVLGLVGCGALGGTRLVLSIAPFQVQDVGEVPCTVVAAPLEAPPRPSTTTQHSSRRMT